MITQSFAVVAPLFLLIALGALVQKLGLVSEKADAGLSEFVFVLAIPALLFRTVATAELPDINPGFYWASYFISLALCWGIASFAARREGRDSREAAIIGFAAAQSNTVLIGIPIILASFGDQGKVPVVLLIGIHLPITMTVVTVLIARGEAEKGAMGNLLRALITHPILIGIFAGGLWRVTGLPLPMIIARLMDFLAGAAAPCALVSLGMSMNRISLSGSLKLLTLVCGLKLVVHPVLVWVLATKVFALPPVWAASALLFAACPTGVNAYLVSERYKSGQAITSGAITITTLAAIITMTVALAVAFAITGG